MNLNDPYVSQSRIMHRNEETEVFVSLLEIEFEWDYNRLGGALGV